VAELIYADSNEDNIGRAVRLVIMMLIFVFDPLAILMVIAGNMTIMERSRAREVKNEESVATTDPVFEYEEVRPHVDADEVRLHKKDVHTIPPEILEKVFHGPRPDHPHVKPPKS
jgi:hypothetical protein